MLFPFYRRETEAQTDEVTAPGPMPLLRVETRSVIT